MSLRGSRRAGVEIPKQPPVFIQNEVAAPPGARAAACNGGSQQHEKNVSSQFFGDKEHRPEAAILNMA
jgi:hypothetical protein